MAPRTTIDPTAAAAHAGVRIRAMEPEDVEAVSATMEDPGVIHGTLQTPFTPVAHRREKLRFAEEGLAFLGAVPLDATDDVPIGNIGLQRSLRARRIHSATLGMSVRDAWQGKGVGSALMAAAIDLADNWWQVRRIHLEVFTDNEAAVALYRKFGFEIEGTLRQDCFRDGKLVDSYVMARVLED